MTTLLTRKVHFCASHREHNPSFTDEENARTFGKCRNTHGHNYLLEVTVAGETSQVTGLVVDLKELGALLDEIVMRRYDHKMLNLDVPELADVVPTTENLVLDLWRHLAPRFLPSGSAEMAATPGGPTFLRGCRLHRLRLYEDPTLFVDYFGDALDCGHTEAGKQAEALLP